MGGYGQKCKKMPKSLHLTGHSPPASQAGRRVVHASALLHGIHRRLQVAAVKRRQVAFSAHVCRKFRIMCF
jgi:hypothetical protein